MLTLESFGWLTIGLEAAEINGFDLTGLETLPLTGCLPGDDQVFVVILPMTKRGKQDQK